MEDIEDYTINDAKNETMVMIRYMSDWFIDYYVRKKEQYKYLLITNINKQK